MRLLRSWPRNIVSPVPNIPLANLEFVRKYRLRMREQRYSPSTIPTSTSQWQSAVLASPKSSQSTSGSKLLSNRLQYQGMVFLPFLIFPRRTSQTPTSSTGPAFICRHNANKTAQPGTCLPLPPFLQNSNIRSSINESKVRLSSLSCSIMRQRPCSASKIQPHPCTAQNLQRQG
jgi:hypothetical protein